MPRAIVVGSSDLGESDRILRTLTAEHGRWDALVRRARSSKKRFAGLLDLGATLDLSARQGKGSLPVITEVDPVWTPDRGRRELERIALLQWGCELCSATAPRDHPAPKHFGLLLHWLRLLEGDALPGRGARHALEAKALTFAGVAPALVSCAVCALPLAGEVAFDAETGGGVHLHCGSGSVHDAAELAHLEALRRTPLKDLVDANTPGGASEVLNRFVTWQLGRPLKTRPWMLEVLGSDADTR